MAGARLSSRLVARLSSPAGAEADLVLVEPNGDEHLVRCLAKGDGTELGGDGEVLAYLNARYGPEAVCAAARHAVEAEL